jgi:hypothetical protein
VLPARLVLLPVPPSLALQPLLLTLLALLPKPLKKPLKLLPLRNN